METQYENKARLPFWRSRWAAAAMLSVVSAVAIIGLLSHLQAFAVLDGGERFVISALTNDPTEAVRLAGVAMGEHDTVYRNGIR